MRFKKGSIVEVLSKNELPSGSWNCAEVVCSNDRIYTVKYKFNTCVSNEAIIEKVNSKSIRPSPPSVELLENWAPGDVLEIFQNFSWKMATVCEVLGRNDFVVRLVGFSHEFKVCKSDLRVRQSWQDGKWFLIGKNIGTLEEGKRIEQSLRNHNQKLNSQATREERKMNPYSKDDSYADMHRMEPHTIALRKRKRRSSYGHSQVKVVTAKKALKLKVVRMEGNHHHLPEKVTAISSREEKLVEKQTYTAINNRKTQFENFDEAIGQEIRLKSNDEDNITCSVGSCSITSNDLFKPRNYFRIDAECSDSESACCGNFNEGNNLPTKMECGEEIHRLELQAYRCTMEALHACGPLSWEQETLVTNLRFSLNISNDEHLMELRHLASSVTSISFR